MTEIPDDIRKTAERLSGEVWRAFHDDDEGNMSAAQVIAQALLAERLGERERCIAVLERLNGIAAAMNFARRRSQP